MCRCDGKYFHVRCRPPDPTLMNQCEHYFQRGWAGALISPSCAEEGKKEICETDRRVEAGLDYSRQTETEWLFSTLDLSLRELFFTRIQKLIPDRSANSCPSWLCAHVCACRMLHAKASAASVSACIDNAARACTRVRGINPLTAEQVVLGLESSFALLTHPPPPRPPFLHARSGRSLCF